jgi:hypothetical protein
MANSTFRANSLTWIERGWPKEDAGKFRLQGFEEGREFRSRRKAIEKMKAL